MLTATELEPPTFTDQSSVMKAEESIQNLDKIEVILEKMYSLTYIEQGAEKESGGDPKTVKMDGGTIVSMVRQ